MTSLTETTIEIKGQLYTIEPTDWVGLPTVKLVKEDGTSYHVTMGNGRASCTCPDYTYRHAHLDGPGCKHCVACVEAGLFEVEPVACEPEPVACEFTSEMTPFETAIPPTPAWFLALAAQVSEEPIAPALSPAEEAREALSRPDMTIMVWTDECGGYWHQVPNPAHPANSASRKGDSKPAKTPRRGKGRPAKYATVDWASIADRHASGESERSLAESTGIPRTVIQSRLKRMRVLA